MCDCKSCSCESKKTKPSVGRYWLRQWIIGYILISVLVFTAILASSLIGFIVSVIPPLLLTFLGGLIVVGIILMVLIKEDVIDKPDFSAVRRWAVRKRRY